MNYIDLALNCIPKGMRIIKEAHGETTDSQIGSFLPALLSVITTERPNDDKQHKSFRKQIYLFASKQPKAISYLLYLVYCAGIGYAEYLREEAE